MFFGSLLKVAVVSATVFGLTGCFDSGVGAVKAAKYNNVGDFTYGEVLANEGSCSNVKWSSGKNSENRYVVTAECTRSMPHELLETIASQKIVEMKDIRDSSLKNLQNSMGQAKIQFAEAAAVANDDSVKEALKNIEVLKPVVWAKGDEKKELHQKWMSSFGAEKIAAGATYATSKQDYDQIAQELRRNEMIVGQSGYTEHKQKAYFDTSGVQYSPEEVRIFFENQEKYIALVAKQAEDSEALIHQAVAELNGKEYGILATFIVPRESEPALEKATWYLGTKDNLLNLLFSTQIFGRPAAFVKAMDDAALVIASPVISDAARKIPWQPSVKCFVGVGSNC